MSKVASKLEIYGSEFENCKTQSSTSNGSGGQAIGGAIYYSSSDTAGQLIIDKSDINRTKFKDCFANRYGGAVGMNAQSKSLSLKHTDFENCQANRYHGGGIFTDNLNSAGTILDCTFNNCSVTVGSGGGAYFGGNGEIKIADSEFTDSTAKNGAGVHIETQNSNRNVIFEGCDFNRCNSFGGYGAICEGQDYTNARAKYTKIKDCTFTDCKSNTWCGALILRSINVDIENCDIVGCCGTTSNTEGSNAGSVFISAATDTVNVINCNIDNQNKGIVNGGAIHLDNQAKILNVKI
jgi:hypothetical protein